MSINNEIICTCEQFVIASIFGSVLEIAISHPVDPIEIEKAATNITTTKSQTDHSCI